MTAPDSGRPFPLASRLERLCRIEESAFGHYLPVEFFKWFSEALRPRNATTCFLSSGTTQAERSRSYFSVAGLARYRETALATFYQVLGDFFPDPRRVRGFSLVPSSTDWPDSSLSRMVDWIGEESRVGYLGGDPSTWTPFGDDPVWVFGTGFHFVNLLDAGVRFTLPKGSVVFETGGTKGRSRSVTREELYEGIEQVFSIPQSAIISEYGMCELASQAYDWVRPGQDLMFAARRFRFPPSVTVLVRNASGEFSRSGTGALAVLDPARVDYPWCLRTQDIATLDSDGSFRLEGRVPQAVLKGCSLPFEKIAKEKPALASRLPKNFVNWNEDAVRERLPIVTKLWDTFLANPKLKAALEGEWGSSAIATWALEDLRQSAPKTSDKWLAAAKGALGSQAPSEWVLVLPQTHGFSAFHPMLTGLLNGIKFHVRPSQPTLESVESLWLACTETFFPHLITRLSPTFRIGNDPVPQAAEALLCFASDETVGRLKKLAGIPVQGFGNALTLSVVKGELSDASAGLLSKDAFSLGQRGCLSTRLAIVISQHDVASWAAKVLQPLTVALPEVLAQALDQEVLARVALDASCQIIRSPSQAGPMISIHAYQEGSSLTDLVSLRPYVLPMIVVPPDKEAQALAAVRANFPELRHITSDGLGHWPDASVLMRRLGQANATVWDGTHEGRAFFALEGSA